MRAKAFGAACILMLATSPSPAGSSPADHCLTGQTYPAFSDKPILEKMARGVNLPNWDTADAAYRPDHGALTKLFGHGFTHIRLPVFHTAFTEADFGSSDLADYTAWMLSVIDDLTGMGYTVTVDLHPDGMFSQLLQRPSGIGYQHLENTWKYLASALQNTNPDQVALEFLNEPDLTPGTWYRYAERLARKMREWLPRHTFVVGPAGPMRYESLADFKPLNDPNIIYAVHFYDPFIFTHQGAEWHPPDDPVRLSVGVPFPSQENDPRIATLIAQLTIDGHLEAAEEVRNFFREPWTTKDIKNAFDTVLHWSQKHGRPVIMNEFGVLSYEAPRKDRLFWLGSVVAAAEDRCIGWTHWDFSDGFGIVDPRTNEPDIEAIKVLRNPSDQSATNNR